MDVANDVPVLGGWNQAMRSAGGASWSHPAQPDGHLIPTSSSKVVAKGSRDAHRDTGINTCVAVGPIFSLSMESCRVFCSCCFDEHRAASAGRAGHTPASASGVSRGAADFARFLEARRRTRRSARTAQQLATRERQAAHTPLRPSEHSSAHLLHAGDVHTAPTCQTLNEPAASSRRHPSGPPHVHAAASAASGAAPPECRAQPLRVWCDATAP